MRVVRLHEIGIDENTRLIREVFLSTSVSNCGVAEFAPGIIAHENERHVHEQDEVFVILSGEITVPTAGGAGEIARAGDWVFVEAGLEHHLTNHTILLCVAMYLVIGRNAGGS
jgi:quercetin dioxygenase-like cupin family protein